MERGKLIREYSIEIFIYLCVIAIKGGYQNGCIFKNKG